MTVKVSREEVIETAKELAGHLKSWDIPVTRTTSIQGDTKAAFMVDTVLYINQKEIRKRLKEDNGFVGHVATSIFHEMLENRRAHGLFPDYESNDYHPCDLAEMTLLGGLEHQRILETHHRNIDAEQRGIHLRNHLIHIHLNMYY